jgi:1-deoxy-D-xylulose-5-phosphate synthase
LPVLFAIDRAGLVGADGPTHQGAFDISFLRCIPNMIVMTPSDEVECRNMLYTGHIAKSPASVRYPRGPGMGLQVETKMTAIELGKSRTMRKIKDRTVNKKPKVAILNFGTLLPQALSAAQTLDATVIDMRFVKPLDTQAILLAAKQHDLLVTLEDGALMGGAGSAVMESLQANRTLAQVLPLGLPDEFIMQATQQEMYAHLGIDSKGIVAAVTAFLI